MDRNHIHAIAQAFVRIVGKLPGSFEEDDVQLNKRVFNYLKTLIKQEINSLSQQDLTDILCAFGNIFDILGKQFIPDQQLIQQLLDKLILGNQNQMSEQQIRDCLVAMAKFKFFDNQLVNICVNNIYQIQQFQPQTIADILWAIYFLNQQQENIQLIQYLVEKAKTCLEYFQENTLSNFLNQIVYLKYYDLELIQKIEKIILDQNSEFSDQQINVISLFFTEFGISENPQEIIKILIKQFLNSEEINVQCYPYFIYNLSILKCPINQIQYLIDKFLLRYEHNQFTENQLSQVRRADLEYQSRLDQNLIFPEKLERSCSEAHRTSVKKRQTNRDNYFKERVYYFLTQQKSKGNLCCEKNYSASGGDVGLDIVIQNVYRRQAAVFLLMRKDFAVNDGEFVLGRTRAEMEFVERFLGFKVIAVSTAEWSKREYQKEIWGKVSQFVLEEKAGKQEDDNGGASENEEAMKKMQTHTNVLILQKIKQSENIENLLQIIEQNQNVLDMICVSGAAVQAIKITEKIIKNKQQKQQILEFFKQDKNNVIKLFQIISEQIKINQNFIQDKEHMHTYRVQQQTSFFVELQLFDIINFSRRCTCTTFPFNSSTNTKRGKAKNKQIKSCCTFNKVVTYDYREQIVRSCPSVTSNRRCEGCELTSQFD
eukprot:TRINITY_DN12775_c2_g4_i1.p1 TRINITY_DN12775_c2_g4~~TRINITY_DN12775_c2_g4_i1.p1  ORF type:complete len:757 (-),score=66.39 TRINITY_DN12775_c2_g4_i1:388-2349(-)